MREVGAFEAKNTLSALLDLVEKGEEIIITRHGRESARLVPPKDAFNRQLAREAAQKIRDMSKGATLDGISIRELVEEGRR
jgi:prevent-host-death family protein